MIDKALLAKIRKCLALGRSANEHEAAAALAKARALMDENGIDDAMLEFAEIEEAAARASRNNRPPKWESILGHTVCRALKVSQYLNAIGDRCFVGRGARAEVASYAFAVLFRQLKAARSAYIGAKLKRCTVARKRARADTFCEGWAAAVHIKICELMPEPADDPAIGAYLAVQHPGLVTISSRAANHKRAENDFWRGHSQGNAVDLHAGIGAAAVPLALA